MNAADVKIGMCVDYFVNGVFDQGIVNGLCDFRDDAFWVIWESDGCQHWVNAINIEPSKVQPVNDDIPEQLRAIHKALLAMAKGLNVEL